jgi:pilus assembly protein FimV
MMNRIFSLTCRQLVIALMAIAVSPSLRALGLGDAAVHSYLGQPLNARIALIGPTAGELGTVTVDLASVADLEMMGVSRTVSMPLHFVVNADIGDPYIEVTSRLPVSDPVVQVVVEVRWSGGRMLREYTLFLDPPTVASAPPAPRVFRAPPSRPESPDTETSIVENGQGREAQTGVRAAGQPMEAPPEPGRPAAMTGEPRLESVGNTRGPVKRGETLWSIAGAYVSGTGYSINQAMLAIQRLNPDAFGGQNINSLHAGSILQMPGFAEIGRLSKREAMLEAMRQENQYLARRSASPRDALPTLADAIVPDADLWPDESGPSSDVAPDSEEARLQLVPPSGQEGEFEGMGGSAGESTGAVSSGQTEETLARTEEELANAQQENAYLNERIRELEAQLEAAQAAGAVANSDFAEMEEQLRRERISGNEPEDGEAVPDEGESGSAGWWLAGSFLVLVAGAAWFLRRKAGESTSPAVHAESPDSGEESPEESGAELKPETEETSPGQSPAFEKLAKSSTAGEEVVELDSDDPEVKLDLARAYISMGDPDAARAMLEEVIENGDDEQVAEAQEMMREI